MNNEQRKNSSNTFFLHAYALVTRALSIVMIAIMLLFILPLLTPYLEDATSFSYIRAALSAEQEISAAVKRNFPTKVAGKDMTRWIVIIGAFILSGSFSSATEKFKNKIQYQKYRSTMEELKTQMHLSDNSIILSPLNQKLEQLRTAKRRDREQLLKDFAETKKRLDEMGKDLAFLSIDVVDSTGMKEGEERASIEHDFKEYKRYVDRTFVAQGCLKAAWTPDGVMAAFTSVDAAVRAGRSVVDGLDEFNKTVKTIRRDFAVRCGVNSGFVYFDETLPLEEISDRVIDIAAHIQKKAKPNAVCVAKPAIEPLNERTGFEPAGTVVDGYEVYEWRKS